MIGFIIMVFWVGVIVLVLFDSVFEVEIFWVGI